MKPILLFLILIVIIPELVPQQRHRGGGDPQKKINQLEKIKLMEFLDLDDETALKFFSLKDKHQEKMRELREESDRVLDDIDETLSGTQSTNLGSLTRLLDRFSSLEQEINAQRAGFLKDAESLLSPEKYARFLVFERDFRAEIRELIMGDRMRRKMGP